MFTTKTLEFLSANRFYNSREWFSAHKDEYNEYVFAPLVALAEELKATLNGIDSLIVTEPKVDKTISRIFRDMRFCRDGMLFREQMWLSFRRNKREFQGYPEFFFVMSPNELFYGCGYYSASAGAMRAMREMIINNDERFLAAREAFEKQSAFVMLGDKLKKSKYPDKPDAVREWLDRKSICFEYVAENISELFSDKLGENMAAEFAAMKPVYDFFICAEQAAGEKEFRA